MSQQLFQKMLEEDDQYFYQIPLTFYINSIKSKQFKNIDQQILKLLIPKKLKSQSNLNSKFNKLDLHFYLDLNSYQRNKKLFLKKQETTKKNTKKKIKTKKIEKWIKPIETLEGLKQIITEFEEYLREYQKFNSEIILACLQFNSEDLLQSLLNECIALDINNYLIINNNVSEKRHCFEFLVEKNFQKSINKFTSFPIKDLFISCQNSLLFKAVEKCVDSLSENLVIFFNELSNSQLNYSYSIFNVALNSILLNPNTTQFFSSFLTKKYKELNTEQQKSVLLNYQLSFHDSNQYLIQFPHLMYSQLACFQQFKIFNSVFNSRMKEINLTDISINQLLSFIKFDLIFANDIQLSQSEQLQILAVNLNNEKMQKFEEDIKTQDPQSLFLVQSSLPILTKFFHYYIKTGKKEKYEACSKSIFENYQENQSKIAPLMYNFVKANDPSEYFEEFLKYEEFFSDGCLWYRILESSIKILIRRKLNFVEKYINYCLQNKQNLNWKFLYKICIKSKGPKIAEFLLLFQLNYEMKIFQSNPLLKMSDNDFKDFIEANQNYIIQQFLNQF
eukprot:TRINITY_DN6703_c0_g1_i5.p1 TRINITY_DN6703_c0_g1~~TRINITY_DN6703_c0_g1_i5.p1  ORF type:complete len:560 (-),score=98.28 TRINITY_DN6703_c0_g1_i5:243-1922(-)